MGIWNGWGYGTVFFRALKFQVSELEIWQKSLFLQNFRDFPAKFALIMKNIFRTLENGQAIRHQSIPPLSAGRAFSRHQKQENKQKFARNGLFFSAQKSGCRKPWSQPFLSYVATAASVILVVGILNRIHAGNRAANLSFNP